MLEVVASALRSPSRKFIHDGFYQNAKEEWGYYVTVWDAGHYHMISVSHIDHTPELKEIAEALTSLDCELVQSGRYTNRSGTLGWWATTRSGEHWYMVSVSDTLEPFNKHWWI